MESKQMRARALNGICEWKEKQKQRHATRTRSIIELGSECTVQYCIVLVDCTVE